MPKVKNNNGRTGGSLSRIRKKVAKEEDKKRMIPCSRRIRKKSEKEEDKLWLPCSSSRVRKKAVKGKEEKLLIPCSRRIRKEVAVEEEQTHPITCIDSDVATNILTRIPADLLHKNFRHQGREWFDILSSPQFIDANTFHSKPGVIFTTKYMHDKRTVAGFLEFEGSDPKVVVRDQLNVFKLENMRFISSCKGLVLAKQLCNPDLFILNPTTKESVVIPQCGHKCLWHELAFIPNTKEYKLVDMFFEESRETLAFHIRSIGGCWNESYHVSDILKNVHVVDSYRDLLADLPWFEQLSVNGVVYVNLGYKKKMISFDVSNGNTVQLLELPAIGKAVRLIDFSGSLSFVDCLDVLSSIGNFPLDVWVLKDLSRGVWEKKFRIDALSEASRERAKFRWHHVVGTVDNGRILVFACGGDISAYDVKTGRWTRTTTIHGGLCYHFCPRVHVNSLVPIKR